MSLLLIASLIFIMYNILFLTIYKIKSNFNWWTLIKARFINIGTVSLNGLSSDILYITTWSIKVVSIIVIGSIFADTLSGGIGLYDFISSVLVILLINFIIYDLIYYNGISNYIRPSRLMLIYKHSSVIESYNNKSPKIYNFKFIEIINSNITLYENIKISYNLNNKLKEAGLLDDRSLNIHYRRNEKCLKLAKDTKSYLDSCIRLSGLFASNESVNDLLETNIPSIYEHVNNVNEALSKYYNVVYDASKNKFTKF